MRVHHTVRAWVVAAATLVGTAVWAAPPSEAQVKQLLEVTRSKELMGGVMQQQFAALPQQLLEQVIADKNPTPEEQAKFFAIMQRAMAAVEKSISWEKMEPAFIKLYANTFDADDVQAMLNFYQSPAGQKMVAKTPQLTQNMLTTVQELIFPVIQEMEHEIAKAMVELKE